jgi:hypothetical protein
VKVRRRGKASVPEHVLSLLALQDGERVLAVATDPDGRVLVATDRDLLLQRRPPDYERVGWDAIDKATFDADGLRIIGRDAKGADLRLRIPMTDPGSLPEVVRERVTASIVVSQHVALRDDLGVRVTARRRPGASAFAWGYRVDPGLDETDPEVAQAALEAVEAVRRDAGLDG